MEFFPSVKQFFTRAFTDIMVNKKHEISIWHELSPSGPDSCEEGTKGKRLKRRSKENRNKEVVFKETERS